MMILRFRSKEDHEDILKKVKRMKKFTEELEECLEDAMDEDVDYRMSRRNKEWDEEEGMHPRGRYAYRGYK